MRTIVPFASDPLHLQMVSATPAGIHDHLALPMHPQESVSRSASPQQSDIGILVPGHAPGAHQTSAGNSQSLDTSATDHTIQSILEAAKQASVANNGPSLSWNTISPHQDPVASQTMSPVVNQRSSTKRKLDDSEAGDTHNKIRRVVRDHVSQDPARVMPMTTVICLHAAVAQKSYGSEKRFLCPPPVVHIEGPVWNMKQQHLAMAVVTESGERTFEQKAPLDQSLNASFKFLHVSGTAKTKSFQLALDIAEPPPPSADGSETGSGRVWASFDSAPVTIISKPSKKTAKTRSISSCILAGGPVSLFNRINSQTVRTKYMTIDHGQMCASNIAWSAFNVDVRSRPQIANEESPLSGPGPQTVLYGSKIILRDTVTGISAPELIIRKVDKGRISIEDGGPVSQMQKIALQRINPDGSRHYLSAAGPVPGTPGAIIPPTPGLSSQAGSHPLLFQAPRVREEVKDGQSTITDEVDDYLCWTIVGISKFQYTFFDAFGQNNRIPDLPITPFPTLFTVPVQRFASEHDLLELTAANFFYENPATGTVDPLDVYIGPLGPLRIRVFQAAPVPLGTMAAQPFIANVQTEGQLRFVSTAGTLVSSAPHNPIHGPLHTVVIVEMPPKDEVLKAMEESALPTGEETRSSPGGRTLPREQRIQGRPLPLLFIRAYDGIGYHSGRLIACEYLFKDMDLSAGASGNGGNRDWIAEQAARAAENSLNNWTYKVI
ncbi:uncharacterized protein FIBRA_00291 [Fibroporia radiculosa]|uniref:Beta-trefoil DNA-binding domain-containing protein n=1 Tax=Fibroporia radiculosa TaxID=599839 RepID=J7RGT8_9APHY|nr:uncharacterized protein FIBRA_00291 [Fibroporia radiculosa]CCL98297.1 predicted protein [Fibroporia radiculosa]